MLSGGLVEEGRGAAGLMGLVAVAVFVRLFGMVEWWVSLNTYLLDQGYVTRFCVFTLPFRTGRIQGLQT